MSYGRGHVRGPKRERAHSQDWYAAIEAATIARLEQEEAARVRQEEIDRVTRTLAAKLTITEDEIMTWNATQERPVGFRRLPR